MFLGCGLTLPLQPRPLVIAAVAAGCKRFLADYSRERNRNPVQSSGHGETECNDSAAIVTRLSTLKLDHQ